MHKNKVVSSLKAALLVSAMVRCAAWAQEADDAETIDKAVGVEEIVVTARRKAESVQDVPLSIGTLGAEELESRQVYSLTNLRQAVANVTVSKIPVAGGNYLTIRGVTGTSIPNVSVDSSIGIYIDGVYLGRSQSAGSDIADIERVEVNRGPQGTLYGRNSSGGTINFVTRAPAGEAGLSASAIYGNFDRYRGRISVDTPEFGGFSGRLAYVHDEHGGDARNLSGGTVFRIADFGPVKVANQLGTYDSEAVVARIQYRGSDQVELDYKFDFSDVVEVYEGVQHSGFVPGQLGAAAAGIYLLQAPGAVLISDKRLDTLNLDFTGPASVRAFGHLVNLLYSFDDSMSVRSISAYRGVKTYAATDNDNGAYRYPVASAGATIPFCVFCAVNAQKQRQFTQELQLLGEFDTFNFIFGGYYFRERANSDLFYGIFKALVPGADGQIPVSPADLASGQLEKAINKSYAVYAHAEYDIARSLNLAIGARHTMDRRTSIDRRPATFSEAKAHYDSSDYDVALTHNFTPDVSVYGRYATGYQSGGVIRGIPFRPEDNKTAEVGIKSEFLDRKVRFNAAVFRARIKDEQRAAVILPQGLVIQNVGHVTIDGVETELSVAPTTDLSVSANFGYNKPRNTVDDFNLAPKTTFAFNAQYSTSKHSNGTYLTFEMSGDYRGKYYGRGMTRRSSDQIIPGFNLPPAIYTGFPNEQAYLDSVFANATLGDYWLLNGRVTLMGLPMRSGDFRVSAYVRNLTNSRDRNYATNVNTSIQAAYERPRTYGLELSIEL